MNMMIEIDSTFVCWVMAFLTPIIYYCYSLCSQAMVSRANRNTLDQYARIFKENKDIVASFGNGIYQLLDNEGQRYYANQYATTVGNGLTSIFTYLFSYLEATHDQSPNYCECNMSYRNVNDYSESDSDDSDSGDSDSDSDSDSDDSDSDDSGDSDSDDSDSCLCEEKNNQKINITYEHIMNNVNRLLVEKNYHDLFNFMENIVRVLKDTGDSATINICDKLLDLLDSCRNLILNDEMAMATSTKNCVDCECVDCECEDCECENCGCETECCDESDYSSDDSCNENENETPNQSDSMPNGDDQLQSDDDESLMCDEDQNKN